MDNAYSEIQEGKRNHAITFYSLMIMHQWSTMDTQMKVKNPSTLGTCI